MNLTDCNVFYMHFTQRSEFVTFAHAVYIEKSSVLHYQILVGSAFHSVAAA